MCGSKQNQKINGKKIRRIKEKEEGREKELKGKLERKKMRKNKMRLRRSPVMYPSMRM